MHFGYHANRGTDDFPFEERFRDNLSEGTPCGHQKLVSASAHSRGCTTKLCWARRDFRSRNFNQDYPTHDEVEIGLETY